MRNILLIISVFVLFSITSKANDEDIMRAMRDEIKRSLAELKIENLQSPYYVEYVVKVRNSESFRASLGQIQEHINNQSATLNVDIRVGSYQSDNSNFFDVGLSFFGSSDDEERFKNRRIPLELNYNSLRHELWLATDAAYKQASELFSKKEATLRNRMRRDTTHDFMQITPAQNKITSNIPHFNSDEAKSIVGELSSIFRNYKAINVSSVVMEFIPETIYYVNSEGMEYIIDDYYIGLEVVAATQAKDGMPLSNHYSAFGKDFKSLPNLDSLKRATKNIAELLTRSLEIQPLEDSYSGPVLIEGQAAAEAWAQVFVPNLITQRQQITESGVQTGDRFSAFQMKVGGRVLPEFLSVRAIPSMDNYENTTLMGHFVLDDNGIKPEDVLLVENGYLRDLLSERIPTRRIRENNGHKRGGAAMYSNIVIDTDTDKILETSELKSKLIELVKARELPYGIIVRKALNQNILFTTLFRTAGSAYAPPRGDGVLQPMEMYKVYPDGREELVRGGYIAGLTAQSFRDVIFTSKNRYAHNLLASAVISPFMSGGEQYVGATIITPSLLFEDTEIRINDEDFPKPPFVESPLSIKK